MLDFTYPYSILNAAESAVEHLSDPRTQAWIVRRMPGAGVRVGPLTILPYPWADMSTDPDFTSLRLPRAFHRTDASPILVDAVKRARASQAAVLAGHRRGESVVGAMETHYPVACGQVFDWLASLEDSDPRMLAKLPRVTWDQAVVHAGRWHERLAAMREDGIAGDRGTANYLPVSRIEGWYWTQLVTKGALDREGVVMGHCVGSRAYDRHAWTGEHQGPATGIWSLRDADGRSKVTVEVASNGFCQVHGPENERPEPETAPAFETLVGFFAPPGHPFRLPRWLYRAEDGQTSLAAKRVRPDGLASEYTIGPGTVFYRRPVRAGSHSQDGVGQGGDSWVDLDLSLGAMERPIGQIVTELTETVEVTFRHFAPIVEALGVMFGEAVTELVRGIERDPQPASIVETLPAVEFRRSSNRGGEPWYRQHERARAGRPR
ncbi:hypothetical protein FV226_05605 [Methylobacterium sp. WL12]|uniref:PcfJ domain-containing protein n=1 Tax=Methylobacterium sp. WL12 TaxID=2603890 RepID=UPI0011C6EFBF|nr:PcfJ domain-containing protein [Methylobacterium sp. WL12]TXM74847.1 hypothetical protein FV226_05605 [Methylobacterium sp. WL12]